MTFVLIACVCAHLLSFSSKPADAFFSVPAEMTIEAKYGLVGHSALLKAEAGFEEPWRPLTFVGILADGSCWLEHSVVLGHYWPQVAWDHIVLRKGQTYSLFPDLSQIEPEQLPHCCSSHLTLPSSYTTQNAFCLSARGSYCCFPAIWDLGKRET